MKDNFKFLTELMKLRLSHIMTFRLGFFGPYFIDTSYFLVQLFAFEAIYGHVDKIRGWGHGEILVFVGTFSLINALNMIIFFFGVISIPEKIQTGELDLYLTKPVYIDMTLQMMADAGAETVATDDTITVRKTSYRPCTREVEADWSAASYWFEIAAISSGSVSLKGLSRKSIQGDSRISELDRKSVV